MKSKKIFEIEFSKNIEEYLENISPEDVLIISRKGNKDVAIVDLETYNNLLKNTANKKSSVKAKSVQEMFKGVKASDVDGELEWGPDTGREY